MKKAINSDKSDIRKHIKKIRNAIPQEYSDMAQQTIFNRISHITGLAEKTYYATSAIAVKSAHSDLLMKYFIVTENTYMSQE